MRPRHSTHWFKRRVIQGFLFTLLTGLLPVNQVAEALSLIEADEPSSVNPGGSLSEIRSVSSIETRYGLVAILVEDSLWTANTGDGGFFSFLGANGLKEKIQTYAEDVQAALPWTKTIIVEVADDDTPVEIQRMLERFYFEGNPDDSDPTKLNGIVIIGDVPLPVVNKNGHRFISLLPYTDFEEPSYLLDLSTLDFLPNLEAQELQAEVWHGVIVPPLDGQEGIDLLGAFFDKNHAFHSGDEEYTTFDEKVFVGDFVSEEDAINPTAFASYQRFLNLWEEISTYRYTNDLVEELYTDMQSSVEAGDFLDNDGDGAYDEEGSNGIDDDEDGLVDEDLGDGFFGIDNDGDGSVDEDSFEDNNNDADWVYEGYRESDADSIFSDRMMDEDPPGDTTGGEDLNGDDLPDGDGCPGLCGVDDNGDSEDHDGDGYPTGIEALMGWDWTNERKPWKSVKNWTNAYFGKSFSTADEATAYLKNMFVDQFFNDEFKSPTCYFNGVYRPEYDDDEDGFCDEDGSTEMQIWVSPNGLPASGSCAYNDADCDGSVDEDPLGIQSQGLFDDLPDIQAGRIVKELISRYAEMFEQPQGVWNRLIGQTGRYTTRGTDGENIINDYDTAISLISKKDELTLQYLYELNADLEAKLDAIVQDHLAEDIPLIAGVQIIGEMTVGETPPEPVCDPGAKVTDSGACLQFVNHSGFDDGLFDAEGNLADLDELRPQDYFLAGQNLWDIKSPNECTTFAGTDEDGGQLAQFNTFYSRAFTVENEDMGKQEVKDYRNCVPEYESYKEDIPEVCAPAVVTENIRVLDGAKAPDEDLDTSGWESGPEACYEFRELATFNDYSQSMAEFNNWLTGKIRKFRKNDADEEDSYEEFLENVEEKRNSFTPRPDEATLRKNFNELDMLAIDAGRSYTMEDLLIELGYEESSNDDIDTYIAFEEGVRIENPEEGIGMEDVEELSIAFYKYYLKAGTEELTNDLSEAEEITSFYKHVQPTSATINAQASNAGSPNLPIDKTRRVSFIDANGKAQYLNYINAFAAENLADIEAQILALAAALNNVAGGTSFSGEVADFYEEIHLDQLADALEWRFLSIDEKHRYILSHYLGDEEPIFLKARDGYEMASLIVDGSATKLKFAFNGDKPESEEDLEFLYRSQAQIEAALAAAAEPEQELEALSEVSNTTPVLLGEWVSEMEKWLQDIQDTFTSGLDWEAVCGEEYVYNSTANEDANDNGIPDGGDATTSLLLSRDDSRSVLLAGGGDSTTVAVGAKKADGSINTLDNYTQIELSIVSGNGSVEVVGNSVLTLSGGVATFILRSAEPGSYVLRAEAINREDASQSNTLSGDVESKFVYLSTYVLETDTERSDGSIETGSLIEILDETGSIRATVDPETGKLELRDAVARLREATEALPTRILVMSEDETQTYATLFLIPEEKTVQVGNGSKGVFVQEQVDGANAVLSENGVALEENGVEIGLVTATGQIFVAQGYSLDFDNPGDLNVYDPIHIINPSGDTLFTVTIKHSFTGGEIVDPSGDYEDYLSLRGQLSKTWSFSFFPLAQAASLIPDTDGDLLDDLEEWVIGTVLDDKDSDSDTYLDGLEIFSGYDPLAQGKKLFTDIDAAHEAYRDLAVLYVRGVIKGYSDGSFRPDNPITREEFVKIDLGAICLDCDSANADYEADLLSTYAKDPFPDTSINPELLACVAEAKVRGIVSGYAGGADAGYFLPTKTISRAEATKVLVETAGYDAADAEDGEAWYSGYVAAAEEHNLFPDGISPTTAWLEGNITRSEFVMMAVNLVEDQDCRSVDSDGEGLSDTEETVLHGTDPELSDTDQGGVNDLDEVLRGSDPLDASDDFPDDSDVDSDGDSEGDLGTTFGEDFSAYGSYDHEPGLYAVSETAQYEQITVDNRESTEEEAISSVNVYTNKVPADGTSTLYVRAEIRDQNDELYFEDKSSVIEFILSSSDYGEIDREKVQVNKGVAETTFTTSKVAGTVTIEGRISDASLPSLDADILIYPGEPVRLELEGESSVLPAGAEAASDMRVYLYDRFGNLASNGFYSVTFTTEGGLTLLDLKDEDSSADGVQVTTADGSIDFRVLASPEVGEASVQVTLPAIAESGDEFTIDHKESLSLSVLNTKPYLLAGGSSGQSITVNVVDDLGIPVTGFQGDVEMSLSDPGFGTFEDTVLTLEKGTASTTVYPGPLAGTGSIIAESAGIEGGSSNLTVKPDIIYELRIRKEDGTFEMDAGKSDQFFIEGFDVYGNLVSTDSSTTGTIRLTDSTAEYGSLSSSTFTLNQGVATVDVTTGEVSGKISVVAAATGLLAGTWGGTVNYSLEGAELAEMDLQMLYGSVLGGPFGDVTQENYAAGWMTFNGKTQAVTSLVAEPKPKKPLASIDASGAISLAEDGLVTQVVKGAGHKLPMRIQWRAFPDDTLLGEILYVVADDSEITAALLTSDRDYALAQEKNLWVLREESAAVVKVRGDGQVVLVDPSYSLVVNGAAEGLGLVVTKNTKEIMRIDYTSNWEVDVESLGTDFNLEDWRSLDSGVYLKPTGASVNHLSPIPTGNSSLSPMGLAIVDPEQELDKSMQASLGYLSLESAEDNGNIGWEDENKHLLLFAAGNTVGESNLFYTSEVAIHLGDPTIRLTKPSELGTLGYDETVGSMVSTSNEEIIAMLDMDYNGDGKMDILTAYENGSIEVLQNADASVRLQNRGELLFIENGIESIDKGDFNNDGLDDLIIATEEACFEGEMCLYLYENIGGGFLAQNLNLSGIRGSPKQINVGDLNADGYDDLVLADENLILYIVWNSFGTLEDVVKLKDFGLNVNPSENLYGDLLVHYGGLGTGSASLPIPSSDFSSSETLVGDLSAFLVSIGADDDFEADVSSVTRNISSPFEYADHEDMIDFFELDKSLSDLSGSPVEVGDRIGVTVSIRNNSGGTLSEIYLSDSVGNYFDFEAESFVCNDCSTLNSAAELIDGDSGRPFIYGPLTLSNAETLSFTYELTVNELPQLSVMLGNDFYADYKDDNYLDIAISPVKNNTGDLFLFYSDGTVTRIIEDGFLGFGESSYKQISYQEKTYSPELYEDEYDLSVANPLGDEDENGIPDFVQNMDDEKGFRVPAPGSYDVIAEVMGGVDSNRDGYYSTEEMFDSEEDLDGDGFNDVVDNWVSGSELLLEPDVELNVSTDEDTLELELNIALLEDEIQGVSAAIEEVVSMFTCDGGCLAFPGSVAFLAPGTYHMPLTGAPLGADPGTPVFGILPTLPVVCAGQLCYASSIMRLYLAPTTTLGLGLGICLGPYAIGQCFAYSVPILQLLQVCDAINGAISNAMSGATSFVSDLDGSIAMNLGDTLSIKAGSSGLESAVFTDYEPPIAVNTNIQVPGFPSIFTEWWKAQKEEFFKMLDLPDITFIYPDPKSLTTEFTGIGAEALQNQEKGVIDLDQENKVEQMTSGILGLEKWLNMAHALPLIDIEPEIVNIRYPAFTREELEILKRDAADWVEDTKEELKRFKSQFEFRDDLNAAQKEVVDEIIVTLEEAITAVETNMSILESYAEIPEQILIIRELEAYYAKVVICYIDAILSQTAGYLSENVDRIEAWGQWVVDLRKIIDGWQILIELSMDLMDSCDKCTNQRYSGLQLLFSLFVFVPEFPVVEMPKLPDIVIDVSNIQAGVDIVWPDINFIPERINIPELPRIALPNAEISLDVNLDLDLDIPTLPQFDIGFEVPALPPLTLPNLPTLPPPPAIPELDPTLSAALNVTSSILKIVCIIRQGFIPTSEFTLKAKIEEITERPGGIVLPTDLAVEVEWPEFNYDFLKEIQVNTTLNLTMDFSTLYDLIAGIGEQSDELVTDLVQDGINKSLEDVFDEVQDVFDYFGNYELDLEIDADASAGADLDDSDGESGLEGSGGAGADVEVETGSGESSFHEAYQTALNYKNEPLVMQNLTALKQVMDGLQIELDAWDQEMPDQVVLQAEEELLALDDPRLHRYAEVSAHPDLDPEFLASIEGTPLSALVGVRDSLLAYTEDLEQGTLALRGMDDNSFQRYLAQEDLSSPVVLASREDSLSMAAQWVPERFVTPDEDLEAIELAAESATSAALSTLDLGNEAQKTNQGLLLYNSELGVSERLTAYTAEADERSHIVFVDLDSDGDKDIVYTMGGDIYFKENYTEEASLRYITSDPDQSSVDAMDPLYGSVQNLKRGKNDYEEASFSFNENNEALGYEVIFYDSLDAQEAEPEENIKRLLLLDETENESTPFTDESGNGVGSLRSSRLMVEKKNGQVTLKNGFKRTIITDNGEIEVSEPVVLQTIEDISLKFSGPDGTNQISIPAGTVVSFSQSQDRLIRIESGSVYWIDSSERIDEQDLEEGMEIFAEELVALESRGADVRLALSDGLTIDLDKEESFVMDKLLNTSNPSAQISMENGAYYGLGRSVYGSAYGTLSDTILLNPQVCADDSEPYALVDDDSDDLDSDGDGAIEIAIFSTKELSAEGSFDSDSTIATAYWDLDSTVDSNGDGIANNDDEYYGLTAQIGPYQTVDDRLVTLYLIDSAGNTSQTETAVEVYVPELTITEASSAVVKGVSEPLSALFPFHLIRDRDGALNEIGTGYSTDEYGEFEEQMIPSDLLSVYDDAGEVIAAFNSETKQALVYDDDYDLTILPSDADWPSRLSVYEKGLGNVMASFVFVSENTLPIRSIEFPLEEFDLTLYNGVTVHPVADEESYEFTDSTLLAYDNLGSLDLMVTQSGNITLFDDRYRLLRREADSLDDYLIIEVYDGDTLELEIWPGTPDVTTIVTTDELNLSDSPLVGYEDSLSADDSLYFEDIEEDDVLYEDITELVERGILEGYLVDGDRYFRPDQAINRAEFAKIVLGILCIVPRESAYDVPQVFSDILDPAAWYFPYTKEAYLQDFITGYLGEIDASGLAPFKPVNTITRAEASKIILEALNSKGIIDLPEDVYGEPWYEPYMEIAQDLTPYMTSEATAGESKFIVTEEEARDPMHELTRYEFVEMSVRVLKSYNCFELEDIEEDTGDSALEGYDGGIYAVMEACKVCPCNSLIDYNNDLRPGDKVFAIIRNAAGEIFGVSNTMTIEE